MIVLMLASFTLLQYYIDGVLAVAFYRVGLEVRCGGLVLGILIALHSAIQLTLCGCASEVVIFSLLVVVVNRDSCLEKTVDN